MVSTRIPAESNEMNESTEILMVSTGIPVKKFHWNSSNCF